MAGWRRSLWRKGWLARKARMPVPGITVVGVDGSDLTARYLHDYLSVGATVWQYSENTIDFDRFDSIDSFVDANSSKITLAKCVQ